MVPYIALLNTRTIGPTPSSIEVASSCPVIIKPPSPQKPTTSRSGWTSLAATAAGTPYPIAPLVGPSWRPGRRYCRKRLGQPLKLPASLVTIALSGRRSRSHPMIAPRSSERPEDGGVSPVSYSARTAALHCDQGGGATGA